MAKSSASLQGRPQTMSHVTCHICHMSYVTRNAFPEEACIYQIIILYDCLLALQVAGHRRTIRRRTRGRRSASSLPRTLHPLRFSLTYNQLLPLFHYVSSSVDFHILFKLRRYLLRCSEGVQKADEERHCLTSPCHPNKILRLFWCYYRHSSDPSTEL